MTRCLKWREYIHFIKIPLGSGLLAELAAVLSSWTELSGEVWGGN